MSTTVPFSMIEESVHHIEHEFQPWNIQAELETTVTVDVDRLGEAAATACAVHPIAGARKQPSDLSSTRFEWELPDDEYEVEVGAIDGSGRDLEEIQNQLYYRRFDLIEEPPFRVLVVRGAGIDGGDRILVSMNHVAADGVGTLRIAQALCEAYRGDEPMQDSVSFRESRSMLDDLRPSSLDDGLNVVDSATRHLQNVVDSPTRIARVGGTDEAGWRFARRKLDADLTARLIGNRPDGVSVNDVLQAALHMAIAEWNEDHGKSARKISVMMPINLRPDDWFYQVAGMYSMFESVETRTRDRTDHMTAAREIGEQTEELTERDRAAALYKILEMLPPGTPVELKRQLPRLLRGPGRRLLDTAMLSNLGRIPAMPSLEPDAEERPWFSPPAWRGTPVSIGVATFQGEVNLSFRYLRSQFDQQAGEEFADYVVDHVERAIE
ncbi:wax ester/triacylglycerol synthase domain-containing protein [Halorientalis regularis]|nr:wax ester/triacylglycerol synthase domain-containing protein [Halorientalis regularis]